MKTTQKFPTIPGARVKRGVLVTTALLCSAALNPALGASHSDAPLIKQDPQANITDVYAFVGTRYDNPGQEVLNVMVQVRPFSDPGDGVIYERFADDAQYSIHLTDPVSGETMIRYNFKFSDVNPLSAPALLNPNTILSYGLGTELGPIMDIGDARQNYTQTYGVSKVTNRPRGDTIGAALPVPPPNVGVRTTPLYNDPATGKAVSGAVTFGDLDVYTQQAVAELNDGSVAFAGPREDGFYSDIPGIFDLLDPRIIDNNGDASDGLGQDGGGVDGFMGFNVLAYGLQIPLSQLEDMGSTVGVYASVGRQRVTIRSNRREARHSGPFIQVNRMGNPLFNEALVALADKDRYNRTSPTQDAALFEKYALNPELALLINAVFGTSFTETGRTDLAGIFIPDVLRVNLETGPVPLAGQAGFNRLSVFGGDTTNGQASGFPNGRRFGDDVIDIALTAVAEGTIVGDNVNANDQLYNQVFPYAGTPHAGPTTDQRQSP